MITRSARHRLPSYPLGICQSGIRPPLRALPSPPAENNKPETP